jgi:hypothetical protein
LKADPREIAELNSLLELADDLQTRVDAAERTMLVTRLTQLGVVMLGGATAVVILLSNTVFSQFSAAAAAALLVVTATVTYAALIQLTLVARTRKRLRRNVRALAEVVTIVQGAAFSAMTGATVLERASLAVRLSRFDIPPFRREAPEPSDSNPSESPKPATQ